MYIKPDLFSQRQSLLSESLAQGNTVMLLGPSDSSPHLKGIIVYSL